MNELMVNDTITSIEIAEIAGKNHRDVMRSIRNMEPAWIAAGQRSFAQSSYVNQQGKSQPMYKLTKTECLFIATKFNDEARAKLVIRWESLEKKAVSGAMTEDQLLLEAMSLLNRRLEMAAQKTELLEATIKQQAPAVQYAENVLMSESCHATTTIAKELGISAIELNKFLKFKKVQYFVDGHWVLTHKYQKEGLTKTRTHTYIGTSGQSKTSVQTVWTEKGRRFIHNLWETDTEFYPD